MDMGGTVPLEEEERASSSSSTSAALQDVVTSSPRATGGDGDTRRRESQQTEPETQKFNPTAEDLAEDDEENKFDYFLDNLMYIDAKDLKQYCERKDSVDGVVSNKVFSQLLTDSCINRFSRDDTTGDSIIRIPSDGSDEGVVESTNEEEDAQSSWYGEQTPVPLEDNLKTLTEVQGRICGFMLRSHIMVMLKHKVIPVFIAIKILVVSTFIFIYQILM